MSFLGIGTSKAASVLGLGSNQAAIGTAGSGITYQAPAQAYIGAAMPQQGSGIGSVLKKALVGGVAGAGLGAGYGLLAGMVSFLPHVTIPMGALIGGAAGAVLGLIKGAIDLRRERQLGMQNQIAPGAGLKPITIPAPAPLRGGTYALNAKSAYVKHTQTMLKRLGLYDGKITGKMDSATIAAIKHYEQLKGAPIGGKSTPQLRSALAQDVQIAAQLK